MGCDIHGIIEQRKPGGRWEACPAQIARPGRDYSVFANLGGVRNYNGCAPIAAKRGIPADACHDTHVKNCLYVAEIEDGRCVTKARAEGWISKGCSKWHKEGVWVTNPGYHSHSWCTPDELKQALDASSVEHMSYIYLRGIMGLAETWGHECRFVFWFDS